MLMQSDKRFYEPTDSDAARLRSLVAVTDQFRKVSPVLPVSYMQAFLLVSLKPGLGVSDYAQSLDMQDAVASRILGQLGSRPARVKDREIGEGYELIDVVSDPLDTRRKRHFVTAKGRRFLEGILKELSRLKV